MSLRNGKHLRAARTLAGLTQRQLAAESGLHRNSVKLWENRPDRIGGHAVSAMVNALGRRGVQLGEECDDSGRPVAVVKIGHVPQEQILTGDNGRTGC